ncbi:hypothetical protein BGZ65_005197, partial [Modicella reniformis]
FPKNEEDKDKEEKEEEEEDEEDEDKENQDNNSPRSMTSVGTGLNGGDDLNSGASFAEGRRDPTMDVMALKDSVMTNTFFGNDSVALDLVSSLSIFGGDFTTFVRHGHATSEEDSTSTSVNVDHMQQELAHYELLQMDALDQHGQPTLGLLTEAAPPSRRPIRLRMLNLIMRRNRNPTQIYMTKKFMMIQQEQYWILS